METNVLERLKGFIVLINAYNEKGEIIKQTYAVALKEQEVLITGFEILEDCTRIEAVHPNISISLANAWVNLENHILILQTDSFSFLKTPIGDCNQLKVGQNIFVFNRPKGHDGLYFESKLEQLNKVIEDQSFFGIRLFSKRFFKFVEYESNLPDCNFIFNTRSELIGISTKTKSTDKNIYGHALRIDELIKYITSQKDGYIPITGIKLLYMAEMCYQKDDFELAIKTYSQFLGDYPTNSTILLERAKAFIKAKKFNEANDDCKRALQIEPDLSFACALQGYIYVFQNDYDKAALLFSEAITKESNYIDNYFNVSYCYQKKKNYEQAYKYMNSLQEKDPNIGAIYQIKGDFSVDNFQPDKAIELYLKALELDPDNKRLYYFLCNAYYQNKNYYDSLDYSNKAIEINRSDAYAYHLKALSLYQIGTNMEEVLYNEKKAVDLDPKNSLFRYYLGSFNFAAGDFEMSLIEFKVYLMSSPDPKYVTTYYSMILDALKDTGPENVNFMNFVFALIEQTKNLTPNSEINDIVNRYLKELLICISAVSFPKMIDMAKSGNMGASMGPDRNKVKKQIKSEQIKLICKVRLHKLANAFTKQADKENIKLIHFESTKALNQILHDHFEDQEDINIHKEKVIDSNPPLIDKIKWNHPLPLLAYFVDMLLKKNIISADTNLRNKLIRTHFCKKNGEEYKMKLISGALKKYKDNIRNKNAQQGLPKDYIYVDDFIAYIQE